MKTKLYWKLREAEVDLCVRRNISVQAKARELSNGGFEMVKKASVPNFFICPISLHLMKEPVTLTTGQTYDRRSIEKWFTEGHNTCPSTMQVLSKRDIAPNRTLQRLIQQWCSSNNHGNGVRAAPVEAVVAAVSSTNAAKRRPVMEMLEEVATRGAHSHQCLRELRSLVRDLEQGPHNRTVLVEAGAGPVLANVLFSPENLAKDVKACEEALGILVVLLPSLQNIRGLLNIGAKQLTAISWFLNRGSIDSRVNAALLLGNLALEDEDMKASVGNTSGIFEGLVQLLKEEHYQKAVEAGLQAILAIMSDGEDRNVVRAVEAGVVFAVVDRLAETDRRSKVQTLTKLMELICSNAEGRAATTAHALVVPLLVRIIVNENFGAALESAVSCLWTLCLYSPGKCVDEAAGQVRILTQLSHVVQSGDSHINPRTKQRAALLLRQLRHSLQHCSPRF